MEITSEIYESIIRKILSEKSDITLIQFKDRYCEFNNNFRPSNRIITRGKNKGKTASNNYNRNIEYIFNRFIKFAGNPLIKEINSEIAQKFIIQEFNKAKYSGALTFRVLRAAFNWALDSAYITVNPFKKIKLPKIQKNPPAYITFEQLETILQHIPDKLNDIYKFAFFTGLRLGELTNLKWKNVNIREKFIQVGDDTFTTKSKKVRFVPLCDQAAVILTNRVTKIFNKERTVFCKTNNMPFTNDWLSKTFKRAVKKTNLDQSIHLHTLRHSFASNLVIKGCSIYHLKELLGHQDISTTQNYSHLNMDALRNTVNKFDSIAIS